MSLDASDFLIESGNLLIPLFSPFNRSIIHSAIKCLCAQHSVAPGRAQPGGKGARSEQLL